MNIRIYLQHIPSDRQTMTMVDIHDDATIRDLIVLLRLPAAIVEFDRYYQVPDPHFVMGGLPFIISETGVIWHASYDEARLIDFFKTHGISDHSVHMIWWSQPGAGGYGIYDPFDVWRQFYAIIQYADPLLGAGSAALVGAGAIWKRLKSRASKDAPEVVSPSTFASLLLSRSQWSASELADLAQIHEDEAKGFLRGYGYEWNPRRQAYVRTDRTEDIVARLRTVTWYRTPNLHGGSSDAECG